MHSFAHSTKLPPAVAPVLAGVTACAIAFALVLASAPAAQAVEQLAAARHWTAWHDRDDSGVVCYIASKPTKSEGNYSQRGDIFALVSHRPDLKRNGEVSFVAGYAFKEESQVTIKIGSKSFTLFTRGSTAWATSPEDDKALIAAMKASATMIVRGVSVRGTETTDTFSLFGFTAALKAANQACGL